MRLNDEDRRLDFLDFVFFTALAVAALFAFGWMRANGAEPEPRRYTVAKPEPKIEPVAQSEPLPLDTRPVVYFYSTANCTPCKIMEKSIDAGEYPDYRFEKRPAPAWVRSFPTLEFKCCKGSPLQFQGTLPQFVSAYKRNNPDFEPARYSMTTPAAGTDPVEMFHQFAGDSGRITFTPDKPIDTTLSDGTRVKYKSITGKYAYRDGHPILILDGDKPAIYARKYMMKIGLSLNEAEFEPPSTVTIGTSRGRFSVKLEAMK